MSLDTVGTAHSLVIAFMRQGMLAEQCMEGEPEEVNFSNMNTALQRLDQLGSDLLQNEVAKKLLPETERYRTRLRQRAEEILDRLPVQSFVSN